MKSSPGHDLVKKKTIQNIRQNDKLLIQTFKTIIIVQLVL